MEYKVNDTKLIASTFIPFVNQIWKGDYDMKRTEAALPNIKKQRKVNS